MSIQAPEVTGNRYGTYADPPIRAVSVRDSRLGAFALLLLVGVVRESGAIPSFGDAYIDLLGAFVPFTCAALVLCFMAWSTASRTLVKRS